MPTVPFSTPRLTQAPIANTESQSRATGADFGSQTAGAIGNLGGAVDQAANLYNEKQKENEQRFTMEAFNQYQVEAGKAQIAYQSLQGMDVTPEARDQYLQDVKNAATKYRSTLPPRAQRLYDQEIGRDHVAKTLDAQAHFTQQGKVATEDARKATYTLAANSAAANYGTEQGLQDQRRMLGTIDAQKGITPEDADRQKMVAMSGLAADVVDRRIKDGDLAGAQKAFDDLRSTQLVSSDVETQITGRLDKATERQRDGAYVDQVMSGISKDIPVNDHVDLDSQEQAFYKTLDGQKAEGVLSQDEYDRRRARGEASFSDQHRSLRVTQGAQSKDIAERIRGAGGLAAAKLAVADLAADPKTAWAVNGAEKQAIELFGNEAQKQAAEDARTVHDPRWRDKSSGAIMKVIESGGFNGPDGDNLMRLHAFDLGLNKADADHLSEALKNSGRVKGLTQDDVLKAVTDPTAKEAYKKNPEDLFQLWRAVTDGWDPKVGVDDAKLHDTVAKYRWEGMLKNGDSKVDVPDGKGGHRNVTVTYAAALAAGKGDQFLPNFTGDHTQAQLEAELQAKTGQTIARQPAHKLAPDQAGFEGQNIQGSNPNFIHENNSGDAARAYLLAKYGIDPVSTDRAAQAEQQRQGYIAALGQLGAETHAKHVAEADFSSFLGSDASRYGPKGSGQYGVEGARRQLNDALSAGKIPDWLQKHYQAMNDGKTLEAPAGKSDQDAQRRIAAQKAFLQAVQNTAPLQDQ